MTRPTFVILPLDKKRIPAFDLHRIDQYAIYRAEDGKDTIQVGSAKTRAGAWRSVYSRMGRHPSPCSAYIIEDFNRLNMMLRSGSPNMVRREVPVDKTLPADTFETI